MTSLSASAENIWTFQPQAFKYHQLDTQASWEHPKHAGIWKEYGNTSLLPVSSSFFPAGRRIRMLGTVSSAAFGHPSHPVVQYRARGRRWGHIWLPHFSLTVGFNQAPCAAAPDGLGNHMWPVGCTFVTLHSGLQWKETSAVPFYRQIPNSCSIQMQRCCVADTGGWRDPADTPPGSILVTTCRPEHQGPGNGLSTDEMERQTALQVQHGGLGKQAEELLTSTALWWAFWWNFDFWSKYIEIYLQQIEETNWFSCLFFSAG